VVAIKNNKIYIMTLALIEYSQSAVSSIAFCNLTGGREERFTDKSTKFSPAGAAVMLRSKVYTEIIDKICTKELYIDIDNAKWGKGKRKKRQHKKNQKQIEQLVSSVITENTKFFPLFFARENKEFVAILNDNYEHTEIAVSLGLADAEDDVLCSFYFRGDDSEVTCLISVNPRDDVPKEIMNYGRSVSYEPWCCGGCGIVTDRRLKCGACRCAVYCSKDCQREAWASHKLVCGALP